MRVVADDKSSSTSRFLLTTSAENGREISLLEQKSRDAGARFAAAPAFSRRDPRAPITSAKTSLCANQEDKKPCGKRILMRHVFRGSDGVSSQKPEEWAIAHQELVRLAKARAVVDWEQGEWMLRALRAGVHVRLAYATFAEYIERLFGDKPRTTEERLRVAEALEELPEMSQLLRTGVLCWSAVRELTRVTTQDNVGQWLEAARGRTVREIERLVRGHSRGDKPDNPVDPSLVKHTLRFQVRAETIATFREAMAKLGRDSGEKLDDDAALLLMARHILGGPTEEGRAGYQIALTVCEQCGRGAQQAAGEMIPLESEVIEMASCDAQLIGSVDAAPPAALRHDSAHVSDADTGPQAKPARATQTIPPAVRRRVMRRDGGRCVVPGCRNSRFIDVHHIHPRAEGGGHEPDGLVCLCGRHHRALHRGQIIVEGRVSTGLTFRHADGTVYGQTVSPLAADAYSKLFQALRSMGFRETEARQALERVRASAHVGADASVEVLLREALKVLAPN